MIISGTPIAMADGSSKPIENVNVGDRVLAYDLEREQRVAATVAQVFTHGDIGDLVRINNALVANKNQSFYANGAWLRAGELVYNDMLFPLDPTRSAKVKSFEDLPGKRTVHNIEVAEHHTYFAGDVLVHN